jgi:hypothetical protein
MPLVKITPYECERNLFPRLCAKCGVPTESHVRFAVPGPVGNVVMGTLLSVCPPLFVATAICIRRWKQGVLVPMCETHKADWEWRDRTTSYSYLVFAVAPYCSAVVLSTFVLDWSNPGLFVSCFVGYFFVWCIWVVPAGIIWTRTVRSTGLPRRGFQLSGVHPDFVRALAEDRVRDANPERTAWFGDHRDDFDEDMNWLQSVRHDPK